MDRWTHSEEAELQRLMNRKNEVTKKNMAPLVELAKILADERTHEHMAEALAHNADAFRDALEPFDSGCRVAAGAS